VEVPPTKGRVGEDSPPPRIRKNAARATAPAAAIPIQAEDPALPRLGLSRRGVACGLGRGRAAGRLALDLVLFRAVLALAMEGLGHRSIAPFPLWTA
jgi:hypothetical protein